MKPPAFQFYPDDFIGGTATMTHEERGLYILALCVQWSKGGISLDEFKRLGRGLAEDSLSHVLTKFEQARDDGMFRNHRLEQERAKQSEFRAKQALNGAKRWPGYAKPQPSLSLSVADAMPNGCFPSPSPSPINTPLPPDGGEKGNGEVPNAAMPPPGLLPETVTTPTPPWQPTEMQKRFNRFFNRRDTTPWSKKEISALRALGEIEPEVLATTERYYAAKLPKDGDYRRHDLLTLLNNWNGECDRARRYRPTNCL